MALIGYVRDCSQSFELYRLEPRQGGRVRHLCGHDLDHGPEGSGNSTWSMTIPQLADEGSTDCETLKGPLRMTEIDNDVATKCCD